MTTEQRLDSIERLLGTVATSLQTVATNLEATAVITRQNSEAIDRLEVQVASNSASVDRVVKSLEDSCNDLVSMIGRSVDQGDRDRAEIRRILDYLFGQQRNGNGSGSQGG